MRIISNFRGRRGALSSIDKQPCVKAIRLAKITPKLKEEAESFIERNRLPDCGMVPPNCLKAHLLNTAKKLRMNNGEISSLKKLFKSEIGYEGYYLDNGELRRI